MTRGLRGWTGQKIRTDMKISFRDHWRDMDTWPRAECSSLGSCPHLYDYVESAQDERAVLFDTRVSPAKEEGPVNYKLMFIPGEAEDDEDDDTKGCQVNFSTGRFAEADVAEMFSLVLPFVIWHREGWDPSRHYSDRNKTKNTQEDPEPGCRAKVCLFVATGKNPR